MVLQVPEKASGPEKEAKGLQNGVGVPLPLFAGDSIFILKMHTLTLTDIPSLTVTHIHTQSHTQADPQTQQAFLKGG
jgi:hypothetical protein